mgnify:CR=1 FL=1
MTRSGDHHRFARFLAVGVLNTAFGYALYALLIWLGLAPQPALAVSFAIGVMWNYLTHARLVFDQSGYRRVLPYAGAYGLIYLINAVALQAAQGLIDAAHVAPGALVSFAEARAMIQVAKAGLPGDRVLLVGDMALEQGWCAAGRLAGYVPAARYFAAG